MIALRRIDLPVYHNENSYSTATESDLRTAYCMYCGKAYRVLRKFSLSPRNGVNFCKPGHNQRQWHAVQRLLRTSPPEIQYEYSQEFGRSSYPTTDNQTIGE